MKSPAALLVVIFLLLLFLSPIAVSHNVGDSYSYRIYARIDLRFKSWNLTVSSVPNRLVIVVNGTTEFSITRLGRDSVSLRLRPDLTVSGEVEPSNLQQNLQELLGLLNAQINREYEVSVPLSILGYAPYGGLGDFVQSNLGVNISWFSASLNVTTARFTTWKSLPALLLEFAGNITSTQYGFMSIHIEGKSYLDTTTFLTLYSEGRAICSISYSGVAMDYLIEVKSELINIDAIKDITPRAYGVRFEEGESRIYVSSENLSILSLNTTGNNLILRVSGTGLGGITIFTTQNIRVFIDGKPANYQVLRYGNGKVIKIPLILSEHEVRITYEKTIKSAEEIPVVQAGVDTLLLTLTMIIAPIVVLIVLIMYLLRRK